MSAEKPPEPAVRSRFSENELARIALGLSALKEFHDGYRLSRQTEEDLPQELALQRFFTTALIAYVDGFFPSNRQTGMLPVLRLMGCTARADDIEKALDTKIGDSTFGQMVNLYRDKMIAHPQFSKGGLKEVDDEWKRHMPTKVELDRFMDCTHEVFVSTAIAYAQFADRNPEFAAHQEAPAPVDNTP